MGASLQEFSVVNDTKLTCLKRIISVKLVLLVLNYNTCDHFNVRKQIINIC